ncbi:hypothetical protein [Saccharopolyspora shandongensis]|uniref:hypothetical protein n=1 Tax=Saccharopolyspora shandongensis TaxID=418495 RepID=UPI0033FDB645
MAPGHGRKGMVMANNEQEQERTERLLALARRQVPAQAKLLGAQQRGDTQVAEQAQAELDDVDRAGRWPARLSTRT